MNLCEKLKSICVQKSRLQPVPDMSAVIARDDAARLMARLFQTEDGRKVMAYLRALLLPRVGGPEATDAALRYQDGQRSVLTLIQGFIDQGRS